MGKKQNKQCHKFHPSIIRASDIRGIVGKTLNTKDAYYLGLSFGSIVVKNNGKTVCVGYDGRFSSPALSLHLKKGLTECGLEVLDVGLSSSPMLYHACKEKKSDAGIIVTASHNPVGYNGFKIMLGLNSFADKELRQVEEIAKKGDFLLNNGGKITKINIIDDYVNFLANELVIPKEKKLKIVWDCGNGACGEIVEKLTKKNKL